MIWPFINFVMMAVVIGLYGLSAWRLGKYSVMHDDINRRQLYRAVKISVMSGDYRAPPSLLAVLFRLAWVAALLGAFMNIWHVATWLGEGAPGVKTFSWRVYNIFVAVVLLAVAQIAKRTPG